MGLFVSMSGVAGASLEEIEGALDAYARQRGGLFRVAAGSSESPSILAIVGGEDERFTILYPCDFSEWDGASSFLSGTLGSPVLSPHLHDEDFWMYVLYAGGEEVDRFNPIPGYWSDGMTDEEYARWSGYANVVARAWPDVEAEEVRSSLVRWDLDDEEPGKTYEDDRHDCLDCFQLTDFMRRLGLRCPHEDRGRVCGRTYRFEIPGPD